MLLLLEYLPQEPADPVYGSSLSGSLAYEWEAQSQYRVRVLKSYCKACGTTPHCMYLQEDCIRHPVDCCVQRFACTTLHILLPLDQVL